MSSVLVLAIATSVSMAWKAWPTWVSTFGSGTEGLSSPIEARGSPASAENASSGSPCFAEAAKLTASDGEANELFGCAVSLWGDRALVGARQDDVNGASSGSAYVLVRSGTSWVEEAKLTPSDGAANDRFGGAVALWGDTALVSATGDDDNALSSGSAYVFTRSGTTWTESAKLTASDAAINDFFGSAVALSGDTALVGALGNDDGGIDSGSAYVFVGSGQDWVEQAKLTASDAAAGDDFGVSVSVDGDTALVGAFGDDDHGTDSGSAYVFARSNRIWAEEAKLTASGAAELDLFGASVSVSGGTALVGASASDAVALDSGSAYVFVRSGTTWSQEARLIARDAATLDFFGTSVALLGDMALVGAFGHGLDAGKNSGAAYVFVREGTGWAEEAFLLAGEGAPGDRFGEAVSLSAGAALVGATGDDDSGPESGSAYVFAPPPPAVYCTAGISASGCQASIGSVGAPSATATSGFSLVASGVEGAKDGLFFFGTSGQQASPWGSGTSLLCVAPPVTRAGLLAGTGTAGLCDGAFAQDLNALWCPTCPKPQKNPGPCTAVQAQLWYRDPQTTSNQPTGLSDALEFVLAP